MEAIPSNCRDTAGDTHPPGERSSMPVVRKEGEGVKAVVIQVVGRKRVRG